MSIIIYMEFTHFVVESPHYLVLCLVKNLVAIWLYNDYCIMLLCSTILPILICNRVLVICTVLCVWLDPSARGSQKDG
jgi:hypothetical protein